MAMGLGPTGPAWPVDPSWPKGPPHPTRPDPPRAARAAHALTLAPSSHERRTPWICLIHEDLSWTDHEDGVDGSGVHVLFIAGRDGADDDLAVRARAGTGSAAEEEALAWNHRPPSQCPATAVEDVFRHYRTCLRTKTSSAAIAPRVRCVHAAEPLTLDLQSRGGAQSF
ncbi:hypothetical protein ACLOJK_013650 [Asimina triloba]